MPLSTFFNTREHVRADGRIMGVCTDGYAGKKPHNVKGECVAHGVDKDVRRKKGEGVPC